MPERLPYPVVGVPGFEPGASSSRTMRATKLRHTPLLEPSDQKCTPNAPRCQRRFAFFVLGRRAPRFGSGKGRSAFLSSGATGKKESPASTPKENKANPPASVRRTRRRFSGWEVGVLWR